MHEFQDGMKVESIHWDDDETLKSGSGLVKDMSISLESGHMANIAFVKIDYNDGTVGMIHTSRVLVILAARKEGEG